MSDLALRLDAVEKRFGRRRVLNSIDLALPMGSISGLVGANGAGKTTLFSIIAGFLHADRGRLSIAGIEQPDVKRAPRQIGILPQDARFLRQMPIRTHFISYARLLGYGREAAAAEADRVLSLVDLGDAAWAAGDTLSHGMHKRMALAQAFIGEPPILLLDEPTAGLDPASAYALRTLIREQRGRRGVLISSHNLDEIEALCDHVDILDDGRLIDSTEHSSDTSERCVFDVVLERAAPAELATRLTALDDVTEARLDDARERLTYVVDGNTRRQGQATQAILGALAEHDIGFVEIRRGERLETRFLDMTQGRRAATRPAG